MQPLALPKKCGKQLEEPLISYKKNQHAHKKKKMKNRETLHSRLVNEFLKRNIFLTSFWALWSIRQTG